MLMFAQRAGPDSAVTHRVRLPYDARCRSRLHLVLDSGEEAGILLPHGERLRAGDRLRSADGRVLEVLASAESLLEVRCTRPGALTRAAYHLGNRHVAVEVTAEPDACLRLQPDPVLARMLEGLGCTVTSVVTDFEPEAGAYHPSGGGHSDEGHAHAHAAVPHDPGHGSHRAVPRIHAFKPD